MPKFKQKKTALLIPTTGEVVKNFHSGRTMHKQILTSS